AIALLDPELGEKPRLLGADGGELAGLDHHLAIDAQRPRRREHGGERDRHRAEGQRATHGEDLFPMAEHEREEAGKLAQPDQADELKKVEAGDGETDVSQVLDDARQEKRYPDGEDEEGGEAAGERTVDGEHPALARRRFGRVAGYAEDVFLQPDAH